MAHSTTAGVWDWRAAFLSHPGLAVTPENYERLLAELDPEPERAAAAEPGPEPEPEPDGVAPKRAPQPAPAPPDEVT